MPKGSEDHHSSKKKAKLSFMEKRLRKREKKLQKHQHVTDAPAVYEE